MKNWRLGEVCEHGQLGRKCPICERNDEIEELRDENAKLRACVEAADGFVSRVKATEEAMLPVYTFAAQHGVVYRGGTWVDELCAYDAARAALVEGK